MKIIAIVQARMSSSRFPGKMLAPLRGIPLVLRVLARASEIAGISNVWLATSTSTEDDTLAATVAAAGYPVHRGSLNDVLDRFLGALRKADADAAIRLTGDCPLLDPSVVSAMAAQFAKGGLDYLSNISPPSFPDGFDAEIVSRRALEAAHAEATSLHEREHVTPFIRERPDRFPSANHRWTGEDLSALHWSVDQPDDLAIVEELLAEAGSEPDLAALLTALQRRPDLSERSRAQRTNAGGIKTFLEDMERRAPKPRIAASEALWARALPLIPAGTQTLSKGPTQWVRGFAPKYLVRGKGCQVWDADGNEFIDYPMGLGPVTLGHGHPAVIEAVVRCMAEGTAFSLMHPMEIELAERIVRTVPCAEQVRFGKNGSDATSACIRAARALTGRTHVARHGYHGWQDWSIEPSYGVRSRGVPAEVMGLTHPFPYNDLAALEEVLKNWACAAVIMEPVNLTPPAPGYLAGVRDLAHRYGAILVFDEVITGFRYARGGAQEYFGVTPDLCAMGKGLGNGVPVSVVCGNKRCMQPFEDIFFSFTFGGDVAGLAAAMATLDVMEREDYWSHVWRQGGKLQEAYRRLALEFGIAEITDCQGMAPWTVVTFKDHPRWTGLQMKTLFQQEMLRRGILFSGSQFLSLAHGDEEINRTIDAYRESMRVLRFALDLQAIDALTLGQTNEVIFRRG